LNYGTSQFMAKVIPLERFYNYFCEIVNFSFYRCDRKATAKNAKLKEYHS